MDYEKKIREYMVSSKVDQLYKNMLINLFPELAESEDEKIINNIKKVIGWYRGMFTEKSLMLEEYQEINAWLEKQGEQKPADKVEPKFKIGDKVIPKNHQEESLTITKVTDTEYYSGDLLICKIDEQDKWELVEQKSVEWSEEDELRIENLIAILKGRGYPDYVEYLEKLKERYTWKPSKEQLQALRWVCNRTFIAQEPQKESVLEDLYEQLMALYYGRNN